MAVGIVRMCSYFCYKMVNCGIFVGCIVGFVDFRNCEGEIHVSSKVCVYRKQRQLGFDICDKKYNNMHI